MVCDVSQLSSRRTVLLYRIAGVVKMLKISSGNGERSGVFGKARVTNFCGANQVKYVLCTKVCVRGRIRVMMWRPLGCAARRAKFG